MSFVDALSLYAIISIWLLMIMNAVLSIGGFIYYMKVEKRGRGKPLEYDTQFDYHRSALTRISVDLKNQNRFLMVVVLILSAIFISFIAYARRRMRKRFFSAPGDEKE